MSSCFSKQHIVTIGTSKFTIDGYITARLSSYTPLRSAYGGAATSNDMADLLDDCLFIASIDLRELLDIPSPPLNANAVFATRFSRHNGAARSIRFIDIGAEMALRG